jgi:membrane protein YdbS with pleckstrin-like domain
MATPAQPAEGAPAGADVRSASDAAVSAPTRTAAATSDAASAPDAASAAAQVASPPPVADGVERALDPRQVALLRLVGWITTAAISSSLAVALLIVLAAAPLPGWARAPLGLLWPAATLALAWLSHRWPAVQHRHASYRVDGRGIEIRRGVLWRRVVNVPRSRVQHTDVSQGPLARGYGLGTLVIYTAGTDHARVDLHGLAHATALAIRDHLLPGESGDAV